MCRIIHQDSRARGGLRGKEREEEEMQGEMKEERERGAGWWQEGLSGIPDAKQCSTQKVAEILTEMGLNESAARVMRRPLPSLWEGEREREGEGEGEERRQSTAFTRDF